SSEISPPASSATASTGKSPVVRCARPSRQARSRSPAMRVIDGSSTTRAERLLLDELGEGGLGREQRSVPVEARQEADPPAPRVRLVDVGEPDVRPALP